MINEYKTIWITKDGRKIKVKDMEDSHLVNTIKMLIRKYKRELIHLRSNITFPTFQGEMAQFYAERDYDYLTDLCLDNSYDIEELIEQSLPVWEKLVNEAEKRNLEWRN